jgi:hypothetical protein
MLNKFALFCITNENDCIYTCLYIFIKKTSPPRTLTDGMRFIAETLVNTAKDSLLSRLRSEDWRHSTEPARSLHDSASRVALWQLFSNQLSGAGQAASLPIDVSMLPLFYEEHVLLTAIPTVTPVSQVVLGLNSRNLGINQPGDGIGRDVWQRTNEFLSRDVAFVRRTTPETASVVVAESFDEEIQCNFQKKTSKR